MKLLLDTNVLVWWLTDDPLLTANMRKAVRSTENEINASVISVYELNYKARLGRFPMSTASDLAEYSSASGFPWLPLDYLDMKTGATLDWSHRDPWDRLIAAQALNRNLVLLTSDREFSALPLHIIR